jgi:enoyl-CoA hydratase/carnithine racemase
MKEIEVDLSQPLEGLIYEKRDHIAFLTINRPERGNAMNHSMMAVIRRIWQDVRDDPEVRCVIITGAGTRHFSTGADMNTASEIGSSDARITHAVHWSSRQNDVWKPVIAAVNGLANAGGLHFVVDADIVVASTNAAFSDTHVNVGMVGAIENIGLAKRLTLGSALRMTLQGRNYRMPAERAYQLGLVDELVQPEELLTKAEEIASDICKNSPHAVSFSQQAIWSSMEMPYSQAVEYGWALLRTHWRHPDFKEGPRAFMEKRVPEWLPE